MAAMHSLLESYRRPASQGRIILPLLSVLMSLASGCDGSRSGLKSALDAAADGSSPDVPAGTGGVVPNGSGGNGQGGTAGTTVPASETSPPRISVSPAMLDFAIVDVGAVSVAQIVTVTVSGGAARLNPTVIGASFALSGTTCTEPQPAGTCTVAVAYAPVTLGVASGVLSIGTSTVSLAGAGVGNPSGGFTVTDRVELGTVQINHTSSFVLEIDALQSLKGLTCLPGSPDLTLISQTCPSSGASSPPCTFTFAFKASTVGTKSDSIVCTAGARAIQTLVTANVVTGAGPVLDPPTAQFIAAVGATSDVTIFSLTNVEDAATGHLTVALTAGVNDFAIVSSTCSAPLAPHETCAIQVALSPTSAGTKAGALTVTDQGTGQSVVATLAGTVVVSDPSPALTPRSIDFDMVPVETKKDALFTLTNTGGATLEALAISSTATEFRVSLEACPPLAPNATCTFTVTFAPQTAGVRQALITVASAGDGAVIASATVGGTGAAHTTPPNLVLVPSVHDFGLTTVSVPVGPFTFTVTNTGETATGALSLTKDGDSAVDGGTSAFAIESTCNGPLDPGASCAVRVSYKPTVTRSDAATFTITDGSTHTRSGTVHGTAVATTVACFRCGPFAPTVVGETSPEVVCTGEGATPDGGLTTLNANVHGDFAIVGEACTTSTCTLTLVFKPIARGDRVGSLAVSNMETHSGCSVDFVATGL